MPRAEPVEIVASLAHRCEEGVRVVLHLPELSPPTGSSVEVRFSAHGRRFRRPAEVRAAGAGGTVVEVVVPAGRAGETVWRMALRPGASEPFLPIEARLLTSNRRPVSLLPGPAPEPRMPEPVPAHSGQPTPAADSPATHRSAVRDRLAGLARRARHRLSRGKGR